MRQRRTPTSSSTTVRSRGELYSVDELLAKSTLFSDFKAVKEGNVYCTGSNFFQESTGTCDFIEDLHKVLVDETDDNYRFLKHVR